MRCSHCHSFMVKDHLYDLLENDGQVYVGGWRWGYRCAGCSRVVESGEDQDETIEGPVSVGSAAPDSAATASASAASPSIPLFRMF